MGLKLFTIILLSYCLCTYGYHSHEFDEERDVDENADWTKDSSEEVDQPSEENDISVDDNDDDEHLPADMLAPDSLLPILTSEPDIKIKLNKAIDKVLETAREAFTADGQIVINLKGVSKEFGHGFFKGQFVASGGYFKNPASLYRTGDVALSAKGNTVSLQVALGLKEVEAGFNSYKLDIMNIHQSGKIVAAVGQNSLSLKVTLTYSPTCSFHLDYVMFDKLDGIKINITGLGNFQGLFNTLSKWLIDNFEASLKITVNNVLYEKLNKALSSTKICDHIPHLK